MRDAVGQASRLTMYARYTAIWNLLDWPGAVFPTGLVVDPTVDVVNASFSAFGPEDAYNHNLCTFFFS